MGTAAARTGPLAGALCATVLLVGCGGDDAPDADAVPSVDARWSESPVGPPQLPDFAPVPPADIHTKKVDESWTVEFSSTLVNVGEGDFHATATKGPDGAWTITQDIAHAGGGARNVRTRADAVWAGDGHEHWHVKRYVVYHLVALEADGRPTGEERTDHKVGFCIYDFEKAELAFGPDEPVYTRAGCGQEDSTELVMGLSPGWADYYSWKLPGQSIGIDGLPDGDYRIYAFADEDRVFREETIRNNRTWVDFRLTTDTDGVRSALVSEVGPRPR